MSTNEGVNYVGGFQRGAEEGRTFQKEKEWGRWTRFNTKEGLGKYVWEKSSHNSLISTMMSLADTSQNKTNTTLRLPPQGLVTMRKQGTELPFIPKKDDRFMGKMIRFYEDMSVQSVNLAKEEAKRASLLVLEQLEKTQRPGEAALQVTTCIFFSPCRLPQ
jgi:hypothetical protein